MTHFDPSEPPIEWHQREVSDVTAIVVLVLFGCTVALWADFVSSFVRLP
jgi:hypothetical protein